jgi:hypothetical protein
VRLAGLIEALPEAEQVGVYRRLGDALLFLAGVFPDYTRSHALGPIDAARLLRAAGVPREEREHIAAAPALDLFERLGARCYRRACAFAPIRSVRLDVVAEVVDRFQ